MKTILLTGLIGLIAGTLDILPMIKMKLDKYIITLGLATSTTISVAKEDKKSIAPMSVMAVVLGSSIGLGEHILMK